MSKTELTLFAIIRNNCPYMSKYLVSDEEGFSRYLQRNVLEEDIRRMMNK